MTPYKELLEKIFSAFPMYHKQGTSAYKEGLENIVALAAMASHPERKFKTIHVAGTNGKGSVSHLLASCFQEAGYKTGLFTSPHLVDFSERIKINGKPIPEEQVLAFFNRYQQELERIEPSFFEMTTVLAFDYFAKEEIDIAIIEVGLGGRLDATNIIEPELSVITNISKDHTQLLGETIQDIAKEKGGIIKPQVPVVIGKTDPATAPVFQNIATKQHSPIYFADQEYNVVETIDQNSNTLITIYENGEVIVPAFPLDMQGDYQLLNMATFCMCARVLQRQFPSLQQHLKNGIINLYHNTGLSGRWQVINRNPLTICDVGHNIGAFEITIKQLVALNKSTVHFVFGMVNDKDVDAVISLFPQDHFIYYCCRSENDRSLSPEILEAKLKDRGLSTILCDSVANAYEIAKTAIHSGDVIFIGGSCFVVGELLRLEN